VDQYVNPRLLCTPATMSDPSADGATKVLDVRLGEEYAQGHIPGAIHFSTYALNTYDTDPAPLRSFTHMWAFLLAQRGLHPGLPVVVYGNTSDMNAARAFWFLEYLGYENVRLLDGGMEAWQRAGGRPTHDAAPSKPGACRYAAQSSRVATYADVLAAISDPEALIIDSRSRAEWAGDDARAQRNGTIPSAVHLDWRHHLRSDGTFRPAAELDALFAELGLTQKRRVIAFCNTGYRSAHAYLALRLLGHGDVRNYVGSWQEWGTREDCPVVVPASSEPATARAHARPDVPDRER
jgi:thiosulfate/3-mercaptopyruvate sulfurtransferase